MPYYCTVPRCTSMAGKAKNVSFHQFPRDEELAKLWNNILKRGKPYTKYSKVCSLHFKPEDYTITSAGKNKGQWRTLRKDAIPSQNLPSDTPAPYTRRQSGAWVPNNVPTLEPQLQQQAQQLAQAIYMQTMLAMQAAGVTDPIALSALCNGLPPPFSTDQEDRSPPNSPISPHSPTTSNSPITESNQPNLLSQSQDSRTENLNHENGRNEELNFQNGRNTELNYQNGSYEYNENGRNEDRNYHNGSYENHQNGVNEELFPKNGRNAETNHENGRNEDMYHQNGRNAEPYHQNGRNEHPYHQNVRTEHTKISSFKCDECSKCFKDPDVFFLHKRTHRTDTQKENFNINTLKPEMLKSNPILANLLKSTVEKNIFNSNVFEKQLMVSFSNMDSYINDFNRADCDSSDLNDSLESNNLVIDENVA